MQRFIDAREDGYANIRLADNNKDFEIRIIGKDDIMYTNLDREEMKRMYLFLKKEFEQEG